MTFSNSQLLNLQYIDDSIESFKYATNVIETTSESGGRDFVSELYRCPDTGSCTIDNATHIGTRNSTGALVFNDNENDRERASYNAINKGTKDQADDLFTGLTASEQVLYNLRTGNGNQELIDKVTSEGVVIGGENLDQIITGIVQEEGGNTKEIAEKYFNADINVNIKGRNARTTYGDYCYPEDIRDDRTQDRIKFTMKYSKGTRIKTTTTSGVEIFSKGEQSIKGSATLPIQSGIRDQNSVKWNGSTLNAIQAFGAGAALNLFNAATTDKPIDNVMASGANSVGQVADFLSSGAAGNDARTAINIYLAQQAVGTQNLLSRTAGAIINPNVEMLFDAPALRPFTFQFRMSPRDEDEAAQVRSIISFFKQGMAVKTSSSNIFLKAPNIFDIRYITYDGDREVDHPSINRIKTCALLAASVDYTPDGSYMTYDDPRRSMTSYGLTLSFNELDPIYEDDYIDDLGMRSSTNTANEIGF
mgnify:CR=1 FL=1